MGRRSELLIELRGDALTGRERQAQEHRGEDQEDDSDTGRVTGEIHDRDDEERHARERVTQCLFGHDLTLHAQPSGPGGRSERPPEPERHLIRARARSESSCSTARASSVVDPERTGSSVAAHFAAVDVASKSAEASASRNASGTIKIPAPPVSATGPSATASSNSS